MAFLCKSAQQMYMLNVFQKYLNYQKKTKKQNPAKTPKPTNHPTKQNKKKQPQIYYCITQETSVIGILQCGWPVSLDYVSTIYNQAKRDHY